MKRLEMPVVVLIGALFAPTGPAHGQQSPAGVQTDASWNHPIPAWTAAASFGGSGSDIGQAVKVDRDGNEYVTGAFSAAAHFPLETNGDGRSGRLGISGMTLSSEGGTDIFLAKYDRSGKLKWLIQSGGPEDDEGFDIAFDETRNVYVTGVFTDSATIGGMNGTEKSVSGVGQTIFLAKYLPTGELAWVQTGTVEFDSSNNGYGVAVEPKKGSVYVTGVSQGDTTFSSSDGTTHTVAGAGTWHMFLVKFDTAGNFHWGQTNEASPNTVAHKVAVDAYDNVYATGWMEGQTTFNSNDGNDLTVVGFSQPVQTYPDYPGDAYVVKYDSNGNVKWVNHVGGYKGIGTDIAVSHDGHVSITGIVGNINGQPSQAETIVTSQPGGRSINLGGGIFTEPFNSDVFIATFNTAGVLLDARRFGGAMDDGGSGIAYDRHGNLVVAGIFQDRINIDGRVLTGKDTYSLFVAKFSPKKNGDGGHRTDFGEQHSFSGFRLDWAKEADGPGVDGFENDPRIGLTTHGDVLVTGAYEPTARFDAVRLNSAGLEDGFLASLASDEPEDDER